MRAITLSIFLGCVAISDAIEKHGGRPELDKTNLQIRGWLCLVLIFLTILGV